MKYADTVIYDKSKNPKNINCISDEKKVKIALYKPDNMPLSNTQVDPVAMEAAFAAIFALPSGETFVWFNQYQVKQTARKVASWYGVALSSSSYNMFVDVESLIYLKQGNNLLLMKTFMGLVMTTMAKTRKKRAAL